MKAFLNRTAVVIGGGGGVGRGVSLGLASEGMHVVVADIDIDAAIQVRDEIVQSDGSAIAERVDATNTQSLEQLAHVVMGRFQGIDLLVNTVGVILERKLVEIDEAEWLWTWNLNVMTQIKAVQAFLPYLRQSPDTHIVLTVSGAGFTAPSLAMKLGAYSTTKHALVGFAKSLRNELAEEGIAVSLLSPSGVVGNLATTSARSYKQYIGDQGRAVGGQQPAGRKLEDGEVMGHILVESLRSNTFLASNKKEAVLRGIRDEYDTLLGQ